MRITERLLQVYFTFVAVTVSQGFFIRIRKYLVDKSVVFATDLYIMVNIINKSVAKTTLLSTMSSPDYHYSIFKESTSRILLPLLSQCHKDFSKDKRILEAHSVLQ